jgi:protein-S-isoprenylcysteine O-methyltransferase Ste14
MASSSDHLPLYGPGPAYVGVVVALTVVGVAFTLLGIIPTAPAGMAAVLLGVFGGALIAGGIALWVGAVVGSKIDDHIERNRLVTTGVYALVRNPIYSAFTLVCAGAILICGNLWLLILLPVFWVFLTLLMKATEERWLHRIHGKEYDAYCERVNRCIPWFPRKNR